MARPTRYSEELINKYTQMGYFVSTTFADFWDKNAELYPDKEAIIDFKGRITWRQAKIYSDKIALKLLELGFKRDDVVCIQLPNCSELTLFRLACEKAGLISVPIRRTLGKREMEYIFAYVQAKAVVIFKEYRGRNYYEEIKELQCAVPHLKYVFICGDEEVSDYESISVKEVLSSQLAKNYPSDYLKTTRYGPYDVWWLAHTTGTTGLPKLVEFTICARVCSGKEHARILGLNSQDTISLFAPAVGGPNTLANFSAPIIGAKVVMLETFDAGEAMRLIEEEKITVLGAVPTHLAMILRHPDFGKYDLSSLRLTYCTGAPLPFTLAKEFETKTGCILINAYSTMDASQVICSRPEDPPEVRWTTCGKPFGGGEMRIVDRGTNREVPKRTVGEIQIRGPFCSSGYYNDYEKTRESWTDDGWFKTGDLGFIDDSGNLVPVGREKDVIIRGGENVYPVEVESLLLTFPKISDVAIVGMPDPVMGERICAFVVVKKGEKITLEEIRNFLKNKGLAMFKIPERIEIVDQLPRVGETKVDKRKLREIINQRLRGEGESFG